MFEPGETSHAITIPVIGDRLARGNKSFRVKLTAPAGASIGAGSASLLIRDPNISQTVLAMSSQPGDYIGRGGHCLITLSDGVFTATNSANVVTFYINNGDGWTTDFDGTYDGPPWRRRLSERAALPLSASGNRRAERLQRRKRM